MRHCLVTLVYVLPLILIPPMGMASGFLDDALGSVRGIELDKANSEKVRFEAGAVGDRLERAALMQAARDEAQVERITKLERQIELQNEVISNYKALVDALKAELAESRQ